MNQFLLHMLLRLIGAGTIGAVTGLIAGKFWYTYSGRFKWSQVRTDKTDSTPKQERWKKIADTIRHKYTVLCILTSILAQGFEEYFSAFQYLSLTILIIGMIAGMVCYFGEKRSLHRSFGWMPAAIIAAVLSTWIVRMIL